MNRRPGLRARIVVSALGAAALSMALGSGAGAEPGDGIEASGATVDRVGWWHQKNTDTSTPAAIITVPPPPGVPKGTLAVGAINGEPDRLAAIGIVPDAVPGDTIGTFTLAIKEAGPPALNANTDAAKVMACPITAFWVPAENGTWKTRPTFDCKAAAAPGTRGDDGTWTFDLRPIGALWTDPSGTLVADGIVLVEAVDSPTSFTVAFATEGEGALVVTVASEAGTPTTEAPTVDDPDTGEVPVDFGGGDPGFEVPPVGGGDVPVSDLPAPEVSTPPTTEAAASPDTAPVASSGPNVLGNFPGGLIIAIPTFLVLMGLLTFTLGPAGEPAAATRQRGVSRALAARARLAHSPTGPEAT